jgi:hypothetical protein
MQQMTNQTLTSQQKPGPVNQANQPTVEDPAKKVKHL